MAAKEKEKGWPDSDDDEDLPTLAELFKSCKTATPSTPRPPPRPAALPAAHTPKPTRTTLSASRKLSTSQRTASTSVVTPPPRQAPPLPSTSRAIPTPRLSTTVAAGLSGTSPVCRSPRLSLSTPPPPSTQPTALFTSAERHRALAAELFPTPSPPRAVPQATREPRRSISVVEDSEVELTRAPGPAAGRERSVSAEIWWVGDSEDEEHERLDERREAQEAVARTPMPAPTLSVYDLSDEEDGKFGFSDLLIHDPRPQLPPFATATARARRAKRRITLSHDSLSDVKLLPPPDPADKAAVPIIECICISSDEEEEPTTTRDSATPQRQVTPEEDEYDSNAGVLVYEPTPRSRKPIRLLPTPSSSQPSSPTPTRSPTKKKPAKSRLLAEIDLTCSSGSESDAPSRPPPARPAPKRLFNPKPSALSTPRQPSTPRKPSLAEEIKLTPALREALPLALIRELDRSVFRKKWEGMRVVEGVGEGLPDGMEIKWNNKLRNTAGRASWKTSKLAGKTTHITSIDLATKVTDTEAKLRHTLSHELCHIAAWVLSHEIKPSHGGAFKLWAARIMQVRPDILITTTHSYQISFKFRWRCTNAPCSKMFRRPVLLSGPADLHRRFGRHSSSIDPNRHGCPCGSKIIAIDASGNAKVARAPVAKSGWQEYLGVMGPEVRRNEPGIAQGEVFGRVAEMWKREKELAREREMVEAMGALVVE